MSPISDDTVLSVFWMTLSCRWICGNILTSLPMRNTRTRRNDRSTENPPPALSHTPGSGACVAERVAVCVAVRVAVCVAVCVAVRVAVRVVLVSAECSCEC